MAWRDHVLGCLQLPVWYPIYIKVADLDFIAIFEEAQPGKMTFSAPKPCHTFSGIMRSKNTALYNSEPKSVKWYGNILHF